MMYNNKRENTMAYELGTRSLQNLEGVHPDLVKVVKRAIEITAVDFGVSEGVRTYDRQIELFEAKASTTMNSRHIPKDVKGVMLGHAVDLMPFVGGKVRWDWGLYYVLAEAMKKAAIEFKVPIVWGGVWDKQLSELGDMENAVAGYVARRKKLGRKAFIDGPHFELDRKAYP